MKVVGWTFYDDVFMEAENTDEELAAVIKDIKENGYSFCGDEHENHDSCAPILSNGKIVHLSWRNWGWVMAQAHEMHGNYDYSLYYMKEVGPKNSKYPSDYINYIEITESRKIDIYLTEHDEEMIDQLVKEHEPFFYYILPKFPFNNRYYKGDKILFHKTNGTVIEQCVGENYIGEYLCNLDDYYLRLSQYRDVKSSVAIKIISDQLENKIDDDLYLIEIGIL